jgi:hypothetical protein
VSAVLRAGSASLLLGAFAAGPAAAGPAPTQGQQDYRNITAGGPLRPGVYGRIVPRARAAPPPVIYPQPVVASNAPVPAGAGPVYLYVPPGQVRKWKQNCAKWSACDLPVLFVRMMDSPSRWGQWRQRREQLAFQVRD